jgi:glycosyltransferase involved in cell wall biosynthesis
MAPIPTFHHSFFAPEKRIEMSGFALLRVISSMDPCTGGPSQGIRNSIPALQNLGCNNEVVCFDGRSKLPSQDNFPIHSIGAANNAWGWNPNLKPWLAANLQRFDAVIVHGLWQYHCYATTKAIARVKAKGHGRIPKVFVMPHGMLDPWFQTARTRYWKAWRNWLYWKTIERYTIQRADGLLFTCDVEMRLAQSSFQPFRPQQMHNIGYGIGEPPPVTANMLSAMAAACPELRGRNYLLYLGRLHEKKAVSLLLEAYVEQCKATQLNQPMPALVIAGPTEGAYAQRLIRRWSELTHDIAKTSPNDHRIQPDVFFPGMLQGDAKWGAIYGCEAMLLPSHQENFGIAIVEAMACGKPILISDKINICEDIDHAGAGLVEPDTYDGVCTLLKQWFNLDQAARDRMGGQARKCFEENYRVEDAARRLLDVIGPLVPGSAWNAMQSGSAAK